jgi:hypothetical protein
MRNECMDFVFDQADDIAGGLVTWQEMPYIMHQILQVS